MPGQILNWLFVVKVITVFWRWGFVMKAALKPPCRLPHCPSIAHKEPFSHKLKHPTLPSGAAADSFIYLPAFFFLSARNLNERKSLGRMKGGANWITRERAGGGREQNRPSKTHLCRAAYHIFVFFRKIQILPTLPPLIRAANRLF